ncbi:recombinase family protein [Butyrivibrio proteoclasticus]|uniref:recombinase family protein n=1 Tax=Butyrivibrio proteoclasticus TaxID=43305 RepID=UPI0006879BE0|nr:recombinase family protein [Butyrivibrio proteoclasticus]
MAMGNELSMFDKVSAETKNNTQKDERIILYCRISNPSQNIERQVRNLKERFPTGVVVKETYTGTRLDRPKWESVMRLVRQKKVDTIVFDSVSRMSRDKEEGSKLYLDLYRRGISLIFLKEGRKHSIMSTT